MAAFDLWRTARAAMRDLGHVSDAELRNRFSHDRDAAAFELLVHRHGPMVWATCRRMLHDHHAAEDAFQATFLALSRRAGRIHSSVPAWLHRVAVRASLTLLRRTKSFAELDREPIDHRCGPAELAASADVRNRIDQAINRLPNRLRDAFVLCHLHGYSLKEAAAELGCAIGTVESRLARARRQLRGVLAGLKPAAIALSSGLTIPQFLRTSTVQAALGARPVSSTIATLATQAGASGWGMAVPGVVGALAAGLLIVAVGVGQSETPKPPVAKNPPPADKPAQTAKAEADESPLPAGAVARLGTSRFRHLSSYYGELSFSPDGQQLATGNNNNTVCLFDTATGRLQRTLTLSEKQKPRTIRFVDDGKKLAVGSADWNTVAEFTLFNVADGKVIANSKFTGKSQIFVIDFTRDGAQVLVEDRFEKAYLWDVKTAKEVWSFPHPEATFTLPMTADGKSFALAGGRTAELRDAGTGNKVTEFPAAGTKFRSLYHAVAISVRVDAGTTVPRSSL